ncbi:redoxin domain-containing protein [Sphingomonas sp. IC-11]|uniref:redoxin domain-containing protein n=1 Tax=Sphingomonas sp. IC-11 TaxID=2898528 RepID=UPI001E55B2E8|nr:redoxin domain-containing protein [Sphingomonas sp. IC-11]MCD2314943.1 redoxin domain-containing protein [Sphingomonas sp. IC-11]
MRLLVPFAAAALVASPAAADQVTGQQAGNFRLMDADGRAVTLAQFRGKPVVLEWNNPGCPYVQKHYDSGNMQSAQAKARAMGAVWLTINSGAPGKQGHMTGAQAKAFVAAKKAQPTAYLLDPQGRVGKGYGAKTTPHMYLIDASGKLVYQGGIDDKPTADKADVATARNHLLAALTEVKAGKKVSVPEARPYGCSVKYAD